MDVCVEVSSRPAEVPFCHCLFVCCVAEVLSCHCVFVCCVAGLYCGTWRVASIISVTIKKNILPLIASANKSKSNPLHRL